MKNLIDFLATVENGKPRVRPFGFQFFENGKFFFITSNTKEIYSQLLKTPYAEFSSMSEDWTISRVKGQVNFSDNIQKKDKALENSPIAKNIYKTPDNPVLELIYLHTGEAILFNLSGSKSEKFSF
jgi:uncharacterized pyridoxamine 5'-phosphate oxidase family protein